MALILQSILIGFSLTAIQVFWYNFLSNGAHAHAAIEDVYNTPQAEITALYDLYNSTNGEYWLWQNTSYPIWDFSTTNPEPCSGSATWQGLVCGCVSTTSYVFNCLINSLELPGYNLTGILPESIGQLSQLYTLYLYNNNISGSIPDSIGNMTNLASLAMANNSLTGTIPTSLQALTALVSLSLEVNLLTGTLPDWIGDFKMLGTLLLSSNKLKGTLPSSFYNLTSLLIFELDENELTGSIPESWSSLVQLRTLWLNNNVLNGTIPAFIGSMANLAELELQYNQFTGSLPASFCNLLQLTDFFLWNNLLTGTLPNCLHSSNLSRLVYLDLNNNYFSGPLLSPTAMWTSLVFYDLFDNIFTGTIPASLGSLPLIYEIYIYNNELTGTIPSELGLAGLTLFAFLGNNNMLTGSIPSAVANMGPSIAYIWLYSNLLTGKLPNVVTNFTRLQSYILYDNILSGSIISTIGQYRSMSFLQLNNNAFSGTLTTSIQNMSVLQQLYLYDNYLSGTLPSLSNLLILETVLLESNSFSGVLDHVFSTSQVNLSVIQLSDNFITGSLPEYLFELPNLETLGLVSNCLTGSLPSSACSSQSLQSLLLDGFSSANACRNKIFPFMELSAYLITHTLDGGVPSCLLELPTLTTLHLSGTGLTGRLPDIPHNSRLQDLSLSHNTFTGTLPLRYQERQWLNLDLAYNRITGGLMANYSQLGANYSLSLTNNRISGNLPASFRNAPDISVLDGNIFDCDISQSTLPKHDSESKTYSCGSNSFNIVFYSWLGLSLVAILAALGILYYNNKLVFKTMIKHLTIFETIDETIVVGMSKKGSAQNTSHMRFFVGVMKQFRVLALLAGTYEVVVLTSLFVGLSVTHGTYAHQYAWITSIGFITGSTSLVLLLLALIFFMLMVLTVMIRVVHALRSGSKLPFARLLNIGSRRQSERRASDLADVVQSVIDTFRRSSAAASAAANSHATDTYDNAETRGGGGGHSSSSSLATNSIMQGQFRVSGPSRPLSERRSSSNINAKYAKNYKGDASNNNTSRIKVLWDKYKLLFSTGNLWSLFVWTAIFLLNVVIVSIVNVGFVLVSLRADNRVLFAAQLSLAVFKYIWNSLILRWFVRWIDSKLRYRRRQLWTRASSSSRSSEATTAVTGGDLSHAVRDCTAAASSVKPRDDEPLTVTSHNNNDGVDEGGDVAYDEQILAFKQQKKNNELIVREKAEDAMVTTELMVVLFNNIVVPFVVVLFVDSRCFNDLLIPPASVNASYTYNVCSTFETFGLISVCTSYIVAYGTTSYQPPFAYSYQCSASVITYYGSAFIYLCFLIGVFNPIFQLACCAVYSRFKNEYVVLVSSDSTNIHIVTALRESNSTFLGRYSVFAGMNDYMGNEQLSSNSPWWFAMLFRSLPVLLKPPPIRSLGDSDCTRKGGGGSSVVSDNYASEAHEQSIDQSWSSLSTTVGNNPMLNTVPALVGTGLLSQPDIVSTANTISTTTTTTTTAAAASKLIPDVLAVRAPVFDSAHFIVVMGLLCGLLFTFGAVFTPLGFALVSTIVMYTYFTQLKVGRFIFMASASVETSWIIPMINEDCGNLDRGLLRCIWMIVTCSCWFYALFLFDTLGNEYGLRRSLWVIVFMLVLPLLLYIVYKSGFIVFQTIRMFRERARMVSQAIELRQSGSPSTMNRVLD